MTAHQYDLYKQATKILASAGFNGVGQPKGSSVSGSIRLIYTPVGGKVRKH